jgi:hypothetical protein
MNDEKSPSRKILQFAVPPESLDAQLEGWVHKLLDSNDELENAIRRLQKL